MKIEHPSLSEKLRILMHKKNISVEELAEKSQITERNIRNILLKRSKNIVYITRISEALGVEVKYFEKEATTEYINIKYFVKIVNIIDEILEERKIVNISWELLQYFILSIQKYANKRNSYDIKIFAVGLIEGALTSDLIMKKYE